MGENTKIEWAKHTFNPWIGCTKVAPECANCYAETQDFFRKWTPQGWGKGRPRKLTSDANWSHPRVWNKQAERDGERPRVFCASLADVFDAEVEPKWRRRLFDLIEETPNLDWLLLTKRPENLVMTLPWRTEPWPNVWLGTSVGHPDSLWRIADLVSVPAVVHFLSCEPLLADLKYIELHDIEWVICGGESGPNARPMNPDWARRLRDQCVRAGVSFHFKQWGEFSPNIVNESGGRVEDLANIMFVDYLRRKGKLLQMGGETLARVGKANAGRLLDGRTWDELPSPQFASA